LSIGVPVIATACGGPEEFIQRTDGLLVKPGSVDELSSAMLQMYQNYKAYDRLAISEDCKRRFSPSVIAKQLTEIFDDVVDSRRKTN
jgi:glycosyltransferase involved in cell wall biosynthesis